MYSKLGWVIAVAMAIFPFAAVVGSLSGTEGVATVLVVAAICTLFFVVVFIATRITITPEPEAARITREPAPPVAWSWDGVNRQPDGGEESKQGESVKL